MKTLNVSISDLEYEKFGIKNNKLTFADVLNLINKRQFKEHLEKSVELAEKYGLSTTTMDEINAEVKAVRENAKARQ